MTICTRLRERQARQVGVAFSIHFFSRGPNLPTQKQIVVTSELGKIKPFRPFVTSRASVICHTMLPIPLDFNTSLIAAGNRLIDDVISGRGHNTAIGHVEGERSDWRCASAPLGEHPMARPAFATVSYHHLFDPNRAYPHFRLSHHFHLDSAGHFFGMHAQECWTSLLSSVFAPPPALLLPRSVPADR
jgi:hypothetical protein